MSEALKDRLFWYQAAGQTLCSWDSALPFERLSPPIAQDQRVFFLCQRERDNSRAAFAVSHPGQLLARTEDYTWLDSQSLPQANPGPEIAGLIEKRLLTAVNRTYPRWQTLLKPAPARPKLRLNLLAVGDVGGMLLTGLKLLGADLLDSIGIYDLNQAAAARWEYELNQVAWPGDYQALPRVETIGPNDLFACDVFVFCASAGVPPLGAAVRDVRLAQYEKNAAIISAYGAQAAAGNFSGLFAVVSDPVDQLCQAAYQAGVGGLFPEQIVGYGLGVMNARAAYFAQKDSRFASFLREGRAYGPHGQGLVIANSLADYQDALSQELTRLSLTANLKAREMGFKPYIAPALSSGALSLLLTLRGEWHYSATRLGRVWLGARNRQLPAGIELETRPLPAALMRRLAETYAGLAAFEPGGPS